MREQSDTGKLPRYRQAGGQQSRSLRRSLTPTTSTLRAGRKAGPFLCLRAAPHSLAMIEGWDGRPLCIWIAHNEVAVAMRAFAYLGKQEL